MLQREFGVEPKGCAVFRLNSLRTSTDFEPGDLHGDSCSPESYGLFLTVISYLHDRWEPSWLGHLEFVALDFEGMNAITSTIA